MAAAALALRETFRVIPNCETELKSSYERILPSYVVFFVKHLQEMFVKLYNECSLMKDWYLYFQLNWHNNCSDRNQDFTSLGLHPSGPLANKVILVRAQVFIQHSITKKGSKTFLMLFSSAIFNYFLRQCHGLLEPKQIATVQVMEDDKDAYLHFGGAALASMLRLRYVWWNKRFEVWWQKYTADLWRDNNTATYQFLYVRRNTFQTTWNAVIMTTCIFPAQRCYNSWQLLV